MSRLSLWMEGENSVLNFLFQSRGYGGRDNSGTPPAGLPLSTTEEGKLSHLFHTGPCHNRI